MKENKKIVYFLKSIVSFVSIYLLIGEILGPFQAIIRVTLWVWGLILIPVLISIFKKHRRISELISNKFLISFLMASVAFAIFNIENKKIESIDSSRLSAYLKPIEHNFQMILSSEDFYRQTSSRLNSKLNIVKESWRLQEGAQPDLYIETNDLLYKITLDKGHTFGENFRKLPGSICAYYELVSRDLICTNAFCADLDSKISNLCKSPYTKIDRAQAELWYPKYTKSIGSISVNSESQLIVQKNSLSAETSFDCIVEFMSFGSEIFLPTSLAPQSLPIQLKQNIELILLGSKSKVAPFIDEKGNGHIMVDEYSSDMESSVCHIVLGNDFIFSQRVDL